MRVLGIDIGIKGGYAYGDGRGRPHSGIMLFKGKRGPRWVAFQEWLREMDAEAAPDIVVYERPCGRYNALRGLCGFSTLIEQYAAQTETRTIEVPPPTLKKWATGSGRATGEDMAVAAEERWADLDILSLDHAAALWLMAYGLEKGET